MKRTARPTTIAVIIGTLDDTPGNTRDFELYLRHTADEDPSVVERDRDDHRSGGRHIVPVMVSRISHTSIDTDDAYGLAQFWKAVLGYIDVPDDPNEPGHDECMIIDLASTSRLLFIEVPEGKAVKNRLHLDLVPTDRTRDAEIERVLDLGATTIADLRRADGGGWMVMADPGGNEFCILRSDDERTKPPD